MVIIAIANQKGGVGKTTTAAAMGAILADHGRRVLLVDMDPQSSLTYTLGIAPAAGASLADVIGGARKIQDIIKTISPGLDIAPADIRLSGIEIELAKKLIGRELVLKQILQGLPYDVCILDCPPALSLLTVNALCAARAVIVPTLPAAADIHGLGLFLETLETIRQINPLELLGVLVVQYDPRLIMHNQALETIKGAGLRVIGIIPRSVKVQEASAAKQPVTAYDPQNKTSEAYLLFTKGVIKWLKQNPK